MHFSQNLLPGELAASEGIYKLKRITEGYQKAFLLSSMSMQLMLSQPSCSLVGSLARKPSSSSCSTCSGPLPLSLSFLTRVTRSWLFFQYLSQIPSQPIKIKSSSLQSQTVLMSGWPVIVWRWYSRPAFFLQQRSPKHRERFRWLLMRPPSTLQPEDTILSSSKGFYGLWSSESSIISPLRLRAALESPALATQRVLPTSRHTLAVQPTESATLLFSKGCSPFAIVRLRRASSPFSLCSKSSSYLKVYSRALGQFSFLKDWLAQRERGNCWAQNWETSTPP